MKNLIIALTMVAAGLISTGVAQTAKANEQQRVQFCTELKSNIYELNVYRANLFPHLRVAVASQNPRAAKKLLTEIQRVSKIIQQLSEAFIEVCS